MTAATKTTTKKIHEKMKFIIERFISDFSLLLATRINFDTVHWILMRIQFNAFAFLPLKIQNLLKLWSKKERRVKKERRRKTIKELKNIFFFNSQIAFVHSIENDVKILLTTSSLLLWSLLQTNKEKEKRKY
jgi:hypothetical protein